MGRRVEKLEIEDGIVGLESYVIFSTNKCELGSFFFSSWNKRVPYPIRGDEWAQAGMPRGKWWLARVMGCGTKSL